MDSNCSAWIALDQWLPTLRKRQIAVRFTSSVGSNDIVGVEISSPPRVWVLLVDVPTSLVSTFTRGELD